LECFFFFFFFRDEGSPPFFLAMVLTRLVFGWEGSKIVTLRLELAFGFGGGSG